MLADLDLTVSVPAEEWAYCRRRLAYLEMLILRAARGDDRFREWMSAAELGALCLPGLPSTATAISRKAAAGNWRMRQEGRCRLYHATALPARAFDALIARMLELPEMAEQPNSERTAIRTVDETPVSAVAAPPWVLPLMRLIRGEADGDLARAWRILPSRLPSGVVLPPIGEAASTLYDLGLADKIAPYT